MKGDSKKLTDNNNGSSEHPDKTFREDKQHNGIVYLELSNDLKQKAVVESIGIYKRTNLIVTLNHSCKQTIISCIYPKWSKTISDFEKQARRKSLSNEDIVHITNFLDINHEVVLGILDTDNKEVIACSSNERSKEIQEVLADIEKARADNKNVMLDEWQEKLREKYNHLLAVVNRNLPNLWPALEFELSIQKILNIKDCTLPFAGIILGPPSSLKTQVIELLRNWPHTFYTDNFSAKSFVSHTTAVKKEQLAQIDLLPKIKNKCFLTPELAPTFSAKDDDLLQILGIMTRILDGNGYESDSGAQGHRGYSGEMMFTWIGAAVDIPHKVHKYLATLGPKLYFLRPQLVLHKTEDDYMDQEMTTLAVELLR